MPPTAHRAATVNRARGRLREHADLSGARVSDLFKSNVTVAVGTALSRVTGLLRVVVFGAVIGQTALADAYKLANETPNIVYELLLGGVLSATLVPLFSAFVEKRRRRSDQRRDHGVGHADGRADVRRGDRRATHLPALHAVAGGRCRRRRPPRRGHDPDADLPDPDPLLRSDRGRQRVLEQPAPVLRRGVEPDPAQPDHRRHAAVVARHPDGGGLAARRRAHRTTACAGRSASAPPPASPRWRWR